MTHLSQLTRSLKISIVVVATAAAVLIIGVNRHTDVHASAAGRTVKGHAIARFLSTGGIAVHQAMLRRAAQQSPNVRTFVAPSGGSEEDPGEGLIPTSELRLEQDGLPPGQGPGSGNHGPARNMFVNDPCLDPPPTAPFPENFRRTAQSETDVAVLNSVGDDDRHDDEQNEGAGQWMVAGYNDSYGFYNNTQGISGFSYSTDGGKNWIDGGGLPPVVKSGAPADTPGSDAYFGDPVVTVHHRSKTFFYASIYELPDGTFSLAVNRGQFKVAPAQGVESKANTRCEGNAAKFGIPDPPATLRRRIIWEPPVVAVPVVDPADFLDKEWLHVDQRTGELYLAYVRFGADGSTPLELVRSFDGGHTWTPPTIIVPNLADTFNTAAQPITAANGRVVVTWFSQTFALTPAFPTLSERIEEAYSDDDGVTFTSPITVARVNPQGEPMGYNRNREEILNVPFIAVDKGGDDERGRRDSGTIYITYFDGVTRLPATEFDANGVPIFAKAADIHISRSTNNGASWGPEIKVNSDNTKTSHVFPSVQVNSRGTVFVTWIDRRVDPVRNLLNDTWAALSSGSGLHFGGNLRVSNVSTDWIARTDMRPNFGDYNSSAVIDSDHFASIWSDGRFPTPQPSLPRPTSKSATPDSLFAIVGDDH